MKLEAPRRQVDIVQDQNGLDLMLVELERNTETLAIDTERASGFRYSQRAYLIQVGLADGGIFLIDPIALNEVQADWNNRVAPELNSKPWLLHAATQDMPCLQELGFQSDQIIDTELASRLAGFQRVGLGAMVEELLSLELAKEHSAADWSLRPFGNEMLTYAALDVDVLHDLWASISQSLIEQGKMEWAEQEFAALQNFQPKPTPEEPWRNLPGLSRVKDISKLKAAAALWLVRDEIARTTDIAPGRLIPDRSIMAAIDKLPRSKQELAQNKAFQGRASRSKLDTWWQAIADSSGLEIAESAPNTGAIPHHKNWERRFPQAHLRLKFTREPLVARAEELSLPVENLLTPDFLRRVCFEPAGDVRSQLAELGARPWQLDQVVPLIEAGLALAGPEIEKLR